MTCFSTLLASEVVISSASSSKTLKPGPHFLVLLTPSALDSCNEPADWLRREIETAIETRRNIIPLMFDGFDFGKSIANQLTGDLATLKSYNGLQVTGAYFTEAMNRLREQYLNVPLEMVLHPASTSTQEDAEVQKATLVKLSQLIPEEQRRIEEDRDGVEQKVEQRRLEAEARRTGEEAKEKTDVLE